MKYGRLTAKSSFKKEIKMHKKRVIARLDIKNNFVIKGIHLEGLRKIGDPNDIAKKYYENNIDEIFFMDAVASYYDRNSLFHIIKKACKNVFVPITVGGGIRTINDINSALNSGADKVAINTKAVLEKSFIREASQLFGSQCIVASIVAKKVGNKEEWEAYIENGREPTGLNVINWAKELESLGAGEIMLTSLDQEGTRRGFDIDLYRAVREIISIPLIACGGAGKIGHIESLATIVDIDAIAIASLFHYDLNSISEVKISLNNLNIEVRL
jgi:cyclase